MDRKVAKEFLLIRDWLNRAGDIVARGGEPGAGRRKSPSDPAHAY